MKRAEGFSLLEVLIAFTVLSVGIGALAQLTVLAIHATDDARRMSAASVAAAEKLEALRALSWGFDDLGVPMQDPVLTASPADALTRNVDGYFEYLDAAGRPVDADDEGVSGGAAYVRRWRIQPLPAHPSTTIVIEVLVVPSTAGPDPSVSNVLRSGARRLTIRSRRSLGTGS